MPFEDLLMPKAPACSTCAFIEALPTLTAEEVDAAMAKAKYGDLTLARGLAALAATVDPDGYPLPKAPGNEGVKNHRQKGHRRP